MDHKTKTVLNLGKWSFSYCSIFCNFTFTMHVILENALVMSGASRVKYAVCYDDR